MKEMFAKLSVASCNGNTKKDTVLTIMSLTPLLPWFYYVPRYIKNLSFNKKWYKMYRQENYNNIVSSLYGISMW